MTERADAHIHLFEGGFERLAQRSFVQRPGVNIDEAVCLDSQTFEQTFGLFSEMPLLGRTDREGIEGENLLNLVESEYAKVKAR